MWKPDIITSPRIQYSVFLNARYLLKLFVTVWWVFRMVRFSRGWGRTQSCQPRSWWPSPAGCSSSSQWVHIQISSHLILKSPKTCVVVLLLYLLLQISFDSFDNMCPPSSLSRCMWRWRLRTRSIRWDNYKYKTNFSYFGENFIKSWYDQQGLESNSD